MNSVEMTFINPLKEKEDSNKGTHLWADPEGGTGGPEPQPPPPPGILAKKCLSDS